MRIELTDRIVEQVRTLLENSSSHQYTLQEVEVTNQCQSGLVIVRIELQREFPDDNERR